MTWRRALADGVHSCGRCSSAIAKDAPFLETSSRLIRCVDCAAAWGEQPPDEIAADADTSVPAGIRHQPSFGFGGPR